MENPFKYYCGTCKKQKAKSLFYDKSEHPFEHEKKKQQIQEFPREISNYIVLAHIGSGGCGNVFKVCEKSNKNQICSLKICSDLDLIKEIEINKNLDHPNIINLYNHQILSNEFFIVQELGDVDLKKNYSNLQQNQIYNIILELAEGIKYLHDNYVSHLDLKLSNILLKDNHVKIIDFGMSKQENELSKQENEKNFKNETESLMDPNPYSPPEMHEKPISKTNYKADIWAFGIICHLIVAKNNPFGKDWKNNVPNYIINIDKSISINSPLYELIINCLNKDKNNRWEMKEIVTFIRLKKDNFFDEYLDSKRVCRLNLISQEEITNFSENNISRNNIDKYKVETDKSFLLLKQREEVLPNKVFKKRIHLFILCLIVILIISLIIIFK